MTITTLKVNDTLRERGISSRELRESGYFSSLLPGRIVGFVNDWGEHWYKWGNQCENIRYNISRLQPSERDMTNLKSYMPWSFLGHCSLKMYLIWSRKCTLILMQQFWKGEHFCIQFEFSVWVLVFLNFFKYKSSNIHPYSIYLNTHIYLIAINLCPIEKQKLHKNMLQIYKFVSTAEHIQWNREYAYSAMTLSLQNKEIMICIIAWVNSEDTMLSNKSSSL